jgi:hypothetical protein
MVQIGILRAFAAPMGVYWGKWRTQSGGANMWQKIFMEANVFHCLKAA